MQHLYKFLVSINCGQRQYDLGYIEFLGSWCKQSGIIHYSQILRKKLPASQGQSCVNKYFFIRIEFPQQIATISVCIENIPFNRISDKIFCTVYRMCKRCNVPATRLEKT